MAGFTWGITQVQNRRKRQRDERKRKAEEAKREAKREKEQTDRLDRVEQAVSDLTDAVDELRKAVTTYHRSHIAELQESVHAAYLRHVIHGKPLTIAGRGRINAMAATLFSLDDVNGEYRSMFEALSKLPTYTPEEISESSKAGE